MKSRIVHTKLWTDSWFIDLQLDEKLYFCYLLTNEYCNVLDIYELPMSVAVYQTGIPKERIKEIQVKFADDGKLDFIDDYISLCNAYKYQFYKGAKNNYAKLRSIFLMSDRVITHFNKVIGITVVNISKECKDFAVTDENLLNLLPRVYERLLLLNITLSGYIYPDTPKKSENKKTIKEENNKRSNELVKTQESSRESLEVAEDFEEYQKGLN